MGQTKAKEEVSEMDTGGVVWLPGSGYDENGACQWTYGYNYYACGEAADPNGGVDVYCCPY